MISIKIDECKHKSWSRICDWCQGKPFQCFVCNKIITEKHEHLREHFNDPNQYLTCRMCKVYKHISQYRFKHFYCRLCTHLHKYRFGRTKEELENM